MSDLAWKAKAKAYREEVGRLRAMVRDANEERDENTIGVSFGVNAGKYVMIFTAPGRISEQRLAEYVASNIDLVNALQVKVSTKSRHGPP